MIKKHLRSRLFQSKGFTLIELLVVLGILGILAAALLAAINPVEQLRKGQDTSLKNIATEFIDASTSYYSVQNDFPWTATTPCYSGNMSSGTQVTLNTINNGASGCIGTLVSSGELKASFANTPVTSLTQIVVTYPDPGNTSNDSAVACFKPQSNSQQLDPNSKFDQNGNIKAGCPAAGNGCYWCAR